MVCRAALILRTLRIAVSALDPRVFGFLILALPSAAGSSGAQAPLGRPVAPAQVGGVLPDDIVWHEPGRDGFDSMPLGNGEIGVNAWTTPQGDLVFLIARTDSWGDNGRLLKVGRVRLHIDPQPVTASRAFEQELDVRHGTMHVRLGEKGDRLTLSLWVDAHHPVIHMTAEAARPFDVTATIEPWRTRPQPLPSLESSDVLLDRSKPDGMHTPVVVEPDTVLHDLEGRIGWFHHNKKSVGPALTMRIQGLADQLTEDPLLHRVFGAVIVAEGAERINDLTLRSRSRRSHRFDTYVLTRHPSSPIEWRAAVNAAIKSLADVPFDELLARHEAWWESFWRRSWIRITEEKPAAPRPMIPANTHPLRVGVDQAEGNRYRGKIARLSLFSRALDQEAVAALASGREPLAPTTPDLIGCWRNVEPGTILDEVDAQALTHALTIEAWVRPEALPPSGGRIADKITPGGSDGFLFDTYPGNSLRFITAAGTLEEPDRLTANRWHHVAATVAPASGRQVLYHDGRPVARLEVDRLNDAESVTRGYALQRYINACAGRGNFPIKFNGSLFTVAWPGRPGNADYRRWGPGYWWQNTRLPYAGMCAAGDFDLMRPFFAMYAERILPVSVVRTRRALGHEGAFIPECVYFWGAVFSETYGWTPFEERQDKLQRGGWHKWEWVSGLELAAMMLDFYDFTLDQSFLRKTALPAAREILTFFDRHNAIGPDGKLVMHPAQALETWWDCTDPMPEVAGLHALTARLQALPEPLTTPEQRAFWQSLQAKLPALPVREVEGTRMLAPARLFAAKHNIENPELYAVFPFRLVSFEKQNAPLGLAALEHRLDRGHSGWRQDDIFMATLGLGPDARTNVVARARSKHPGSRFPAFWGPNYDWVPDQDHGSVLVKAVQTMLMQTDGAKIYLLPAWPEDWSVDFKLHARYRTTLRGKVRGGKVVELMVEPPERRVDVIVVR